MSIVNSVPVELTVALGSAEVPIRQMLKMGRGSMIPLSCSHDDPTLVYVNGGLVAKGEIVITGEQMALRITEIVRRG